MSHRTAPVEVRETLSLPGELPGRFLRAVRTERVLEEAIVLDTCNRTELYFVATGEHDVPAYFLDLVGRLKGAAVAAAPSDLYRLDGPDAVRHLFRVSAALDSQIVGEHQILGQVKAAYRLATQERTVRFLLNRLLHFAFRVGKRSRTETGLGLGAVSVAQASVDLAGQIFADLGGKTALLVGAGKMAESAARRLVSCGVSRLIVANRTLSRAEQLADALAQGRASKPGLLDDDTEQDRISCPALLAMTGPDAPGATSSPVP
ncbi:MAG: glutamyl-tRNA reductase, partial [Planctomycetota bacterium]